jgi:hypothetical protein
VLLDVRSLTAEQNRKSKELFKKMADAELKPIHEIVEDTNRHQLDRAFLGDILGLPDSLFMSHGPLHLVRQKLAREPSIRGQKSG